MNEAFFQIGRIFLTICMFAAGLLLVTWVLAMLLAKKGKKTHEHQEYRNRFRG